MYDLFSRTMETSPGVEILILSRKIAPIFAPGGSESKMSIAHRAPRTKSATAQRLPNDRQCFHIRVAPRVRAKEAGGEVGGSDERAEDPRHLDGHEHVEDQPGQAADPM